MAPGPGGNPFDRGASAIALRGVDLSTCARPGGPVGSGHVKITFAMSGNVASAEVDSPQFAQTAVGACIAKKYRAARIPVFVGGDVTVGKSFVLR
jgi:molybdopterin biosynthesis enzyme